MKAIVVRQPWATLIALGVKTIETRPFPPNGPMRPEGVRGLPGCSLERGERIAIVAGAQEPAWRDHGEWSVGRMHEGQPRKLFKGSGPLIDLPLGVVVCTVTVDDALPIVAGFPAPDLPWAEPRQEAIAVYRTEMDRISYHPDDDEAPGWQRHFYGRERCYPLDPQRPLGDFTPGRWGWLLSDPRPCEPIPCKGRQGVFELPAEIAEALS